MKSTASIVGSLACRIVFVGFESERLGGSIGGGWWWFWWLVLSRAFVVDEFNELAKRAGVPGWVSE